MSQLTGTRIFNALKGLLSGLDSTDELLLKRLLGVRRKVKVDVGDGGATATGVADKHVWTNDLGVSAKVISATLFAPITIAAAATDNVTFTLEKHDATNAATATVATYQSNTAGGTATACVGKALTVVGGTYTDAVVGSGSSLIISATKNASGVLIGDAQSPSVIEIELDVDI